MANNTATRRCLARFLTLLAAAIETTFGLPERIVPFHHAITILAQTEFDSQSAEPSFRVRYLAIYHPIGSLLLNRLYIGTAPSPMSGSSP